MKKISPKLRIALLSVAILTVICVTLITISLFISYNTATNYFNKSLIYSIARSLIFVTVMGAVVFTFILPKKELSGESPTTLPVSIISALPCISFIAIAVILFLSRFFGKDSIHFATPLIYVSSAFALLAAVYFVFNCIFADTKNNIKTAIGYTVPISSMLIVATNYFDMAVSMNASIKSFVYIAFISFAFWMLLELRTQAGRQHPRVYFSLGLITAVLTASSSLPWLIAMLSKKVGAPIYPSYIIYTIVLLTLSVYVFARLAVFVGARDLAEKLSEQTYSDDEDQNEEEINKGE